MSSPVVRGVVSLADVQGLVRLYGRVWPGSFGIVDLLASDGDCLLLVDERGQVEAYCFVEHDAARGFVELQDIGVEPDSRGRGLGRRLLDAVKGCYTRVKLIADSTRPDLLRFYENAGFRVQTVIENYYSIGRDGVRMQWSRDDLPA